MIGVSEILVFMFYTLIRYKIQGHRHFHVIYIYI